MRLVVSHIPSKINAVYVIMCLEHSFKFHMFTLLSIGDDDSEEVFTFPNADPYLTGIPYRCDLS